VAARATRQNKIQTAVRIRIIKMLCINVLAVNTSGFIIAQQCFTVDCRRMITKKESYLTAGKPITGQQMADNSQSGLIHVHLNDRQI